MARKRKQTKKTEIVKPSKTISTRDIVYIGTANQAVRKGIVTDKDYIFTKDRLGQPVPVAVDERDYPALISEKGRSCRGRDSEKLFMSKTNWDLELQLARLSNK